MTQKSKALLGKKLGCTQVFDEQGQQVPVTVVELGPCVVTAVRSKATHGYDALQLGFQKKAKAANKPLDGFFKKNNLDAYASLKEFRLSSENVTVGQVIDASVFKKNELVDVRGISKGKGFQGPMRRFHFAGGPATHGSKFHRLPGSSGSGTTPGEVKKGKRRAGHLGGGQACVRNLRVVDVLTEKNVILLNGSVPGPIGSLCWIEA